MLYAYDDATKTTSWSNFPVTFVERAGLNLTELTEEQQTAALAVLESLLSEDAYADVVGIMDGDQYLLESSTTTEPLQQQSGGVVWAPPPAYDTYRYSRFRTTPLTAPIVALWSAGRRVVFDGSIHRN